MDVEKYINDTVDKAFIEYFLQTRHDQKNHIMKIAMKISRGHLNPTMVEAEIVKRLNFIMGLQKIDSKASS